MRRWEYTTRRKRLSSTAHAPATLPAEELDALGREGWELVAVVTFADYAGNDDYLEYIFKRPVDGGEGN